MLNRICAAGIVGAGARRLNWKTGWRFVFSILKFARHEQTGFALANRPSPIANQVG
jgi:hypothetical protein